MLPDAGEMGFARAAKAEFARDDLPGEIAFADEHRDDEHTRGGEAAQDLPDIRLLLPESFPHLSEEAALAQRAGVQANRRGGTGVDGRTVADEQQRGV